MNASTSRIVGGLLVLTVYGAVLGSAEPHRPPSNEADAERLFEASRMAFEANRFAEALPPTLELTRAWPNQQIYLRRLAQIYHHLDRCGDEAAAWERAVEVSPTPIDTCPALPEAYVCAGQPDRALDAYERCAAFDRTNTDMLFYLGRARERAGRVDLAEAAYRDAVRVDANHADSLLGLARLDLRAGRLDQAARTASEVLKANPDHADALLVAGTAAQRGGQPSEARQHLQRALAIAEHYVDVHIALGVTDVDDGRPAEARRHFARALQLDPLRRTELAVWLERTGGVR